MRKKTDPIVSALYDCGAEQPLAWIDGRDICASVVHAGKTMTMRIHIPGRDGKEMHGDFVARWAPSFCDWVKDRGYA